MIVFYFFLIITPSFIFTLFCFIFSVFYFHSCWSCWYCFYHDRWNTFFFLILFLCNKTFFYFCSFLFWINILFVKKFGNLSWFCNKSITYRLMYFSCWMIYIFFFFPLCNNDKNLYFFDYHIHILYFLFLIQKDMWLQTFSVFATSTSSCK